MGPERRMSRLDEIEAREQMATWGPWHRHDKYVHAQFIAEDGKVRHYAVCNAATHMSPGEAEGISDFIAHSRQDIPYLLRVARAAIAVRGDISDCGHSGLDGGPCRYSPCVNLANLDKALEDKDA